MRCITAAVRILADLNNELTILSRSVCVPPDFIVEIGIIVLKCFEQRQDASSKTLQEAENGCSCRSALHMLIVNLERTIRLSNPDRPLNDCTITTEYTCATKVWVAACKLGDLVYVHPQFFSKQLIHI